MFQSVKESNLPRLSAGKITRGEGTYGTSDPPQRLQVVQISQTFEIEVSKTMGILSLCKHECTRTSKEVDAPLYAGGADGVSQDKRNLLENDCWRGLLGSFVPLVRTMSLISFLLRFS